MSTTTVKRGSWIVIVPLAAIAAAYVVWVFLPGRRAMAELREKIRTKQDFVAKASETAQAIRRRKPELEETLKYVKQCHQRIPQDKEIGGIFGEIHELADGAGVRITRFDPQGPQGYEKLRRVPVVLGCNGTFAQVYDFLRTLEKMPATLWISSLRMERDAQNRKDVHAEVDLALFSDNPEYSGYATHTD